MLGIIPSLAELTVLLFILAPPPKIYKKIRKEKILKKKCWKKIKKYISQKNIPEHLENCLRLIEEDKDIQY